MSAMSPELFDRGRQLAQSLVTAFVAGDLAAVDSVVDDIDPEVSPAVINALALMMQGAADFVSHTVSEVTGNEVKPIEVLPEFFKIFEQSMRNFGFIPPEGDDLPPPPRG